MGRRYKVLIEQDETGVYIATAPALPGVVEQGDTGDEAFKNMGAAMRFTLDSMVEEGEELPPSDAPHSVEVRDIELVIQFLPGLPNCTGREAVRAFERLGYRTVRQNGSHVRMKCPGRTSLTVPVHHGKDLAPGTLRGLISKSGFSVEEFEAAL